MQAKTKMCPLTGDSCMEHQCVWYINVMGNHPQTGETINQWGCSMTFLPMLMIENSQQQRQTGAAVESMRNAIVSESKKNREITQQSIEFKNIEIAKYSNGEPEHNSSDEGATDAEFTENEIDVSERN